MFRELKIWFTRNLLDNGFDDSYNILTSQFQTFED